MRKFLTYPNRRQLIGYAMSAAAAPLMAARHVLAASSAVPAKDPFAMLGVASGDPTPDGVVLWCRLVLDLEDGRRWGLGEDAYQVRWEVRDLEAPGRPVVKSGTTVAAALAGFAVHVEVTGLRPRTRYGYRFMLGDFAVEGVTLTAPAARSMPDKVRFAICSCADYEFAWPHAYEFMARDQPDFVVHLGDYIYETTYDVFWRKDFDYPDPDRADCENFLPDYKRVRFLKYDRTGKILTLSQFRRRYAEYKRDSRLKSLHAKCPFIVTWDDHEVENDYAGAISEVREAEDFLARRTNAYRAYFENLPIRLSTLPAAAGARQLYRSFDFGRLLRLNMLDERQYRSDQACPRGLHGGGRTIPLSACPEIAAEIDATGTPRDMLGKRQSQWLERRLATSPCRWNVLAQGVMMAHLDSRADCGYPEPQADTRIWTDGWSGYLAARQRMTRLLAANRDKNPIVLSGDMHAFFVNRVLADWNDQSSPTVAPEFVAGAVSSFLKNYDPWIGAQGGNSRAMVDLDCRHHGYMLAEVTPDAFDVTAKRIMPSAAIEDIAKLSAEPSFIYRVRPGDPEPRKPY